MGTSVMKKVVFEDIREASCSNESSSSSIGKNSDLSEDLSEKLDYDEEVESKYKGPLDAMDELEQVLPIRRGISKFYNGKSKSFASLADASSVKEIAKPNNAYSRKRANTLARNITPLRANGNGNGNGISKKIMSSSNSSGRSALALAVAMNNSESVHNNNNNKQTMLSSSSSSPPGKVLCSLRSFSMADLQHHCVSGVALNMHELDANMD
ncbi:hypothetical protein CASFOL_007120 [Castilleja foliolosa]|uniref:Uncharacterized protein n=1 Tax=Castilleja foliolosa TaxID=1961234 RepID=A0ABD3E930_9LAMI